MRCERAKPLLFWYLEKSLTSEEEREMRNHLRECPLCRKELSYLREVIEAIESYPLVREPTDLTARIMDQIRTAGQPVRPAFRLDWTALILGSGLAALAFLSFRIAISMSPEIMVNLAERIDILVWMLSLKLEELELLLGGNINLFLLLISLAFATFVAAKEVSFLFE